MKTPIIAIALAAIATASLAAAADSTFHPSNDEGGTAVHVVRGTLTQAQRMELDRAEAIAADPDWIYRGEEAGWELAPHSYDFRGGSLVHTDRIPHDTPAPRNEPAKDREFYRALERD